MKRIIRERTDIERHLVKLCKARGWWCAKWTPAGRRGVPDRFVLRPGGKITFIELKAPLKGPTLTQLRRHAELRALGFNVVVLNDRASINLWVACAS